MATVEDRRRGDTRRRIQEIALELFAEQGYEKTSLREIAERLGVTKAALYYHFKTKEDIVVGLFDDFFAQVDELIEWGRLQPPGPRTTAEIIRRYDTVLAGQSAAFGFLQENQHSLRDLSVGTEAIERFRTLAALLAGPGAPLARSIKSLLALIALQIGRASALGLDPATSDEDRHAAALQVALELVED